MSSRKVIVGGCLGCLGVGFVLAVIAFVVVALPALGPGPDPKPVRLSEAVPMDVMAGAGRETPELGSVEAPPGPAEAPPQGVTAAATGTGEWTLDLDLSIGNFTLEPAPPGEGLSFDADYDDARYAFEHEIDEDDRAVRLRFRKRSKSHNLFWNRGEDDFNRIVVRLPRGVPLRLAGEIAIGETRAELGGLHLTGVDLDFDIGDHAVNFSEPTTGDMESFSLRSALGELTVHDLGNASPARVDVAQDLGELLLDLAGDWRRDADVRARVNLGECVVVVPETVHLDVERAAVSLGGLNRPRLDDGAALPEGAPRLTLDVEGSLGEVTVRH